MGFNSAFKGLNSSLHESIFFDLVGRVYCCHLMCICCTMWVLPFFTLDAGLLARSQYSEGPAVMSPRKGRGRKEWLVKQP